MTHHIDLDTITLDHGAHDNPDDGMCVMEAVAYFASEPFSDHPPCVSPIVSAFLRRWNDDLDDESRQKLKPLISLVVGTNTGAEDDNRRAWMATDWMVRTYLPAWLALGGMADQAAAVSELPELTDRDGWTTAQPTVHEARRRAAAARDAAWAAAWAAARDAAWAALRPTVEGLQASALALVESMCAVGRD